MVMVLFLVVLVAGNAQALYRCSGDRVARPECCCPEARPAPVTAVVSDACCCSIETVEAAPAPARAPADRFESVKTFPGPVAVLSRVAELSASRLSTHVPSSSPRPPNPSTLLALKTSFLL